METKVIESVKEVKDLYGKARLITVSCFQTDSGFDIFYHFVRDGKIENYLAILPRKNPSIGTISDVYASAETYELELNEMFGINFKGNARIGERLFLPEKLHGTCPRLEKRIVPLKKPKITKPKITKGEEINA